MQNSQTFQPFFGFPQLNSLRIVLFKHAKNIEWAHCHMNLTQISGWHRKNLDIRKEDCETYA